MADENENEKGDTSISVNDKAVAEEVKNNKGSLFIILGVILLLSGGAVYYFFFHKNSAEAANKVEETNEGKMKEEEKAKEDKIKEEDAKNASIEGKLLYYTLPEITANLRTKNGFMKISLILEYYNKANEKLIEEKIPLIVDQLQLFLRDLQKEDLLGTAMLTKLKESILIRINNILSPVKINAVLLRDLLVQ